MTRYYIIYEECCSARKVLIPTSTLVPDFPYAPNGGSRLYLMARSRSIKNEVHEQPSVSWLIMELLIEMSLCRKLAFVGEVNNDTASPAPRSTR